VQIAEGLAAAHAAGIVHRDLKPENVMVTREGRVKILDFGLAKPLAATPDATITAAGVVMGTPGYMSPEQVRGLATDARTDIFSFGCVLYELLAEQRAFQKESSADTISAILKEDPPELPPSIPPYLRQVVTRCLEKNPADRFQSAKDLAFALSASSDAVTGAHTAAQQATPRPRRWIALGAGLSALALLVALLAFPRVPQAPNLRFTLLAAQPGGEGNPRFSPDGKSVAYTVFAGGRNDLLVRTIDSPNATYLGSMGADFYNGPSWSPDGNFVYFERGGTLYRVSASGGAPHEVIAGVGSGTLSPDGRLWVFARPATDQWKLVVKPLAGGDAKPVVDLPALARGIFWQPPTFSPDGKRVALIVSPGEVHVFAFPEGRLLWRRAFGTIPDVSWFPDNRHLLVPSKAQDSETTSLAIVDTESGRELSIFATPEAIQGCDISPDGRRIVLSMRAWSWDIWEFALDGSRRPVLQEGVISLFPDVSPDGKFLAYLVQDRELWIRSLDSGLSRLLSRGSAMLPVFPRFSPDGGRVVYTSDRGLYVAPVSGGRPTQVAAGVSFPATFNIVSWSPDGAWLSYPEREGSAVRLVRVSSAGDGERSVVHGDVKDVNAQASPDGRWFTAARSDGLKLISVEDRKERDFLPPAAVEQPHFSRFSADGRYWVLRRPADTHFELTGYEVPSGRQVQTARFPVEREDLIYAFCMHPDGKRMIANLGGNRADLWVMERFPRPVTGWARLVRRWTDSAP
jgi:Tol biopolymer transport system component